MPGSDRLEEASASETLEREAVVSEATEAVDAPGVKAAPARSRRTRGATASKTTEGEAGASEATEAVDAPGVKAAPARAPRARRAAAAASVESSVEDTPRPARTPRRRAVEEEEPSEAPPRVKRLPRLLEQYRSQVKETLQQEFGYPNVMQIPRLEKVVLNIGLGETKTNPKAMESATRDLALISAQKPLITRARRSIAGFKLREGDPIGTAVTLRGNRMYEFMDRLLNAALPRIRDFRGVSRKAFDGRGNYSLGIREQVIFPEIDYGQIDRIRSLQVAIITTASTDQEAMRLLDLLGMPFTRDAVVASEDGNV
jgi:large subunit ribosomal protein L5